MSTLPLSCGCSPRSKRPLEQRMYHLNQSLLALRLTTFVLKNKEDELREQLLDEAINYFRSSNIGLMVTLRAPIPKPNKFPITDALRDCGLLLKYLRKQDPKMDTPTLVNNFGSYLLTLTEFKNQGVFDQQKLEEIINFYEWYGDYHQSLSY